MPDKTVPLSDPMPEIPPPGSALTRDALSEAAPLLRQPRVGYRMNTDSLLLAAFGATHCRGGRVLDLGAGVGTVGLTLANWGKASEVVLVESQPELAALARQNLKEVGCAGRVLSLTLDEHNLPEELWGSVELVVANPPYFEQGSGRVSAKMGDVIARFGSPLPFLAASARALAQQKARACFAYPAGSLQALLSAAERFGLFAKRLRLVHSKPESDARLALLELRRTRPGGLKVEPPLVEWTAKGERSQAFLAFTRRPAGDPA